MATIGPALHEVGRADRGFGLGAAGRLAVDGCCVWAFGDQLGGNAGLVVHLDEEDRPTVLNEAGLVRALGRFDAALGVDLDTDQTVAVEYFLDFLDRGAAPPVESTALSRRVFSATESGCPSRSSASAMRFTWAESG